MMENQTPLVLLPCDTSIFKNGEIVLVTHYLKTTQIEDWVCKVAQESHHPVDWHSFGGHAVVKTTGDLAEVTHSMLSPRLEAEFNSFCVEAAVDRYYLRRLDPDLFLRRTLVESLTYYNPSLEAKKIAHKLNPQFDLG